MDVATGGAITLPAVAFWALGLCLGATLVELSAVLTGADLENTQQNIKIKSTACRCHHLFLMAT